MSRGEDAASDPRRRDLVALGATAVLAASLAFFLIELARLSEAYLRAVML